MFIWKESPVSALSYTGSLKLIPGDSGHKADDTLDGYNHTHTHIRSHTTDNSELPISLQRMPVVFGGNPSTWRKLRKHVESMKAPHTQGVDGIRNPQPQRYEAHVLTTKPPRHDYLV